MMASQSRLLSRTTSLRALIVCLVALTLATFSSRPAQAAVYTVPINHGTVEVHTMGGIPQSRVEWLVLIADRSSCSTYPLTNTTCDGFMSPGDRVVVGDSYIAFMDLTRDQGTPGNGGGGLLRGLWVLQHDGSGNRNFKYITNGQNHAPNNLLPFQKQGSGGDAHEILLGWGDQETLGNVSRTSESAWVTVWNNGDYNSTNHSLYFHFQGILTKGIGTTSDPWIENLNDGNTQGLGPTQVYYHLQYTFYNDNNGGLKIRTIGSVDNCGSPGCNPTRTLSGLGLSLGIAHDEGPAVLMPRYFKPVTHSMIEGNYPSNCVVPSDRRVYQTGSYYQYPLGLNVIQRNMGSTPSSSFGVRFKADAGTPQNARYYFSNSKVTATGVSLTNDVYHSVFHDHNRVIGHNTAVGDIFQCGIIGTMPTGSTISIEYDMTFEYPE